MCTYTRRNNYIIMLFPSLQRLTLKYCTDIYFIYCYTKKVYKLYIRIRNVYYIRAYNLHSSFTIRISANKYKTIGHLPMFFMRL